MRTCRMSINKQVRRKKDQRKTNTGDYYGIIIIESRVCEAVSRSRDSPRRVRSFTEISFLHLSTESFAMRHFRPTKLLKVPRTLEEGKGAELGEDTERWFRCGAPCGILPRRGSSPFFRSNAKPLSGRGNLAEHRAIDARPPR